METSDRKMEGLSAQNKDQNLILERAGDAWDRKAGTSYSRDETLQSAHSWNYQEQMDRIRQV